MTAEESEASERSYVEMMNHNGGGGAVAGGVNTSYAGETQPTTSIATTVSNIPGGGQILVAATANDKEQQQICIPNHIVGHPVFSGTTTYHVQTGGDGEAYRPEYQYHQYAEARPEHVAGINSREEQQSVANYVNSFRYVSSPGRVITTTTELKPIMDNQDHQQNQVQEIHIYEEEVQVQNGGLANGQSHLSAETGQIEPKPHYTNLDGNYISQDPWRMSTYSVPNPNLSKDYFAGPPSIVYKSVELQRNFPDGILHHRPQYLHPSPAMGIYESPVTSASGTTSGGGAGGPSVAAGGQPPRFYTNQYQHFEPYGVRKEFFCFYFYGPAFIYLKIFPSLAFSMW